MTERTTDRDARARSPRRLASALAVATAALALAVGAFAETGHNPRPDCSHASCVAMPPYFIR